MFNRIFRLAFAGAAPLLLLGCLLTPGKFASSLDVARDGSFTFKYQGELILANGETPLESLESKAEFTPRCEDEEEQERDCTAAELAEQRKTFDDEQRAKEARDATQRAEAAAMFGGIDPKNQATMTEFAARLQREAGWKTVTHRGNGIFDVDYEISGKLDRDFIFPVFPRFNLIVPAVMITRRDDNAILVRAPGFDTSGSTSGAGGLSPMTGNTSKAEGVFILRTDAEILTNNSEEGPLAQGGKEVVQWKVTPLSRTAPEALLRLTQ